MKTVFIGIARMGSTRLPGKVLKPLGEFGDPVIDWVVTAGHSTPGVDEVWIATSTDPRDDVIAAWCKEHDVNCFRGSEDDVLARFHGAALKAKADVVVRVTCDCPFLDPTVIGEVIALRKATGAAYASNNDPPSWPDGLDCEAFTFRTLDYAHRLASRPSDRDTVTQYIVRNRYHFRAVSLNCPIPGLHKERWVLDTEADYEFCKEIAKKINPGVGYLEIMRVLEANPELRKINASHPRNERFFDSLPKEEPVHRDHGYSKAMLEGVGKLIPLASQTFSKSHLQYPVEAPLFVTHGNGGLVYDVDGNEYVDLVGGLLPNILGYRDIDVDNAIRDQLNAGISFSVATQLECNVAHRLRDMIPCAEMVRFGKSGTDVTTAAVRLARHITGRPLVLSQGYHGWADWCIGRDAMRNSGVPSDVQILTELITPDSISAGIGIRGQRYACVIIEPDAFTGDQLRRFRELCDYNGTLLIFDEIISGFRYPMKSVQAYHSVIPDLACFGKEMGHGMPISAVVGKKKYMERMTEICFSGTFFGETLSLAAASRTLDKIRDEGVTEKLLARNQEMRELIREVGVTNSNPVYFHGEGLQRIGFHETGDLSKEETKTLFMQEMIANGVLVIASHNFCFAHTDADMKRVKNAYRATFKTFWKGLEKGSLKPLIKGPSISATANIRANAS